MFRPAARFLTGPLPPDLLAARFLAAVILPPLLFFTLLESPALLFSPVLSHVELGVSVNAHIINGGQHLFSYITFNDEGYLCGCLESYDLAVLHFSSPSDCLDSTDAANSLGCVLHCILSSVFPTCRGLAYYLNHLYNHFKSTRLHERLIHVYSSL